MAYQIVKTSAERIKAAIPFGLANRKPHHFRDMGRVLWKNRDNLGYAFQVVTKGVCDGCALGVAGLHDWTIGGIHLCMTRLNLLRLNTMPALDSNLLADVAHLRKLDNAQLRELGRLPYPMLRQRGDRGFRRISWDEAIDKIAGRIRQGDPKRLAFFVTARGVTNEVYYVSQKVARFLGTNHIDNAARLCHAPSSGAMKDALGVAASTCSYSDWYGTDLLVFFGSNPANDQPVSTKYLHEAKQLGTKVVLVNPYLEPGMKRYWVPSTASSAIFGSDLVDWWFPVTQGGDTAFIYGVLKILVENGGENREFIEKYTTGWSALAAKARSFDFETLEKESGLPRKAMEEFASMLQGARNAVFVWSMGITQHTGGADGVSMLLNLGLARGYVGREKNGLMPIRGHSSVQGGAEMGCYSTALPGGKAITKENVSHLSGQYGFAIPDWPGMTSVEMVEACARGNLDVLYCLGGNFLRTLPDPSYVGKALSQVPLRVHQDIILTDQMFLDPGEEVLLLPAKTRYEQDGGGMETSTERRIMFSPEIPRQVGEARAEWRILRDLAAAVYPDRAHLLKCESGAEIRNEISKIVPFYAGCETLSRTGDAIQYGGSRLCENGEFPTYDGKAHFKVIPLPTHLSATREEQKLNPKLFVVSTRRGKQFNSLIYDETDPLTGASRNAVFINPEDAARLHLAKGDLVTLVNDTGKFTGTLFPAPIARGNLQVHWPEGNVILRAGVVDPSSGVPDYNATVRLEAAHSEGENRV
jgi:molybdopterin-dependent oxidoreductase alpha subunit